MMMLEVQHRLLLLFGPSGPQLFPPLQQLLLLKVLWQSRLPKVQPMLLLEYLMQLMLLLRPLLQLLLLLLLLSLLLQLLLLLLVQLLLLLRS